MVFCNSPLLWDLDLKQRSRVSLRSITEVVQGRTVAALFHTDHLKRLLVLAGAVNSTLEAAGSVLRNAAVSCLESLPSLDITTGSIADSKLPEGLGHEGAPVTTLRWLDIQHVDVEVASCPSYSDQDRILRWAAAMLHDVAATYSIALTGVRSHSTHHA